jgi:hypothetical protein
MGDRRQAVPVNIVRSGVAAGDEELRYIDRTEVAGIIEMQHLLAAGIARIDGPHRGHHVILAIDLVDEDDARFGVLVSRGDDPVPNIRGEDHARCRRSFDSAVIENCGFECGLVRKGHGASVRPAVESVLITGDGIVDVVLPGLFVELGTVPFTCIDGFHEPVGDRDGDVEIRQAGLIILRVDEAKNVRMSDAQDAHIRTAADTALLYDLGRLVDDVHKAHGAGGHPSGRVDHRARGAEKFVGHSGAAAGLMNYGDVLSVLHYPLDRIGNVEHEAGGELSLGLTRIYETRGIGDELAVEHHRGHGVVKCGAVGRICLGGGDMADDASDDIVPGFDRFAVLILGGIPLGDHLLGVEPERVSLASFSGPGAVAVAFWGQNALARFDYCAHMSRCCMRCVTTIIPSAERGKNQRMQIAVSQITSGAGPGRSSLLFTS